MVHHKQINSITNFDSNVDDRMNFKTVISGFKYLCRILNHDLSEGSNLYYTNTRVNQN